MAKLNAILAVEKTAKSEGEKTLTKAYQDVQKDVLINGISRNYQPRDEEGDQLPSESTQVQKSAEAFLKDVADGMSRLFDVTLTKDSANREASADVKVDGKTILKDVPVTYLLFLEKKLIDIKTFITKIPILDPASKWTADENQEAGVYAADPVKTTRTKKIPRNHVLSEATDKHPAQVQVYQEDVIIGDWTTVKFSGALPAARKAALLDRVNRLSDAVKVAREEANSIEAKDREAADAVFGFLFA